MLFRSPQLIYAGATGSDLGPPAQGSLSCRILRAGQNVAIIAFGAAVSATLAAADALADLHITPTVIDGRVARPLDFDTIMQVASDHEIFVVVEPDTLRGMAAEILLHLAQAGQLDAGLGLRHVVVPGTGVGETGNSAAVRQVVGAVLRTMDPDRER